MSDKTPIRFTDLFRYYRGLPHQIAALEQLGELIPASLLHRDNEWFKVWSAGGRITPDWLPVAMKIIREFEGCKLDAYLCPAGVWTIGYGTTRMIDGNVQEGDRITLQEAEEYLQNDVEMAARHVFRVIPRAKNWNADRVAALVSFAYNVGAGQLESSTLRKRLDNDEDPDQVVEEELPKWVKGDGGVVLQGLVRRRRAEITLFTGKTITNYGNPLSVPWMSQLDSETDQGRRMCFTTSCAMLLMFLRPGTITGPNADDTLLARVQQYGDTTSAAAQVQALASYGLKAQFVQNGNFELLEKQIDEGVPVPCGYLHRGTVDKPAGGGHWLICCGYTDTHLIVHDPFGEADLINGTTVSSVARFCHYSKKNFAKRWMVDGPNTGWAIIAKR